MTLTEQWKKGELEVGEYYLRYKDGTIDREYYDYANVYDLMVEKGFSTEGCDISEVLAPVPSYEEWQELKEASDGLSKLMFKSLMNRFVKADEEREKLAEENQQLKELLKKWMHFYPIILYEHEDTLKTKDIVELFDKTREVLK